MVASTEVVPDGSELLIPATLKQGQDWGIFVLSRLGGAPRWVDEGTQSCWSPDGSQIVTAWGNPEGGITVVDKLTAAEKHIPIPGYEQLEDIDCSPRTGLLLLLTQTSEKNQIWTMKLDGTEQRKLLDGSEDITSARWSSIGDAIYYFRKQEGTTELVKLPASGQSKESSVLTSGLETGDYLTNSLMPSADGSQLAYTRTQDYWNLWLVESAGTAVNARQRPLTSGTLSCVSPSISPDGRWIAFTIGSRTRSNVYKMSIDGSQPVQLTFFEAARSTSPAWSPDGRRIAFISNQGGASKVWLINGDGGTAHSLDKTDASNTNYELAWFPSPEIIYQQPGLHNLRRLKVETQEEKPLLSADSEGWLVSQPIYSPDGKKIAIGWNRPPPGVWVIMLDKYSERLVYPGPNVPLGWSSDGNFIYTYKVGEGEIFQTPLGDSKGSKSVVSMPGALSSGTVSRDGRKIVVSLLEVKSDVWLMEDFDPLAGRARRPRD